MRRGGRHEISRKMSLMTGVHCATLGNVGMCHACGAQTSSITPAIQQTRLKREQKAEGITDQSDLDHRYRTQKKLNFDPGKTQRRPKPEGPETRHTICYMLIQARVLLKYAQSNAQICTVECLGAFKLKAKMKVMSLGIIT